jgi:hypothetical protein
VSEVTERHAGDRWTGNGFVGDKECPMLRHRASHRVGGGANLVYKGGIGDWLGTGRSRSYRPFKKARKFVHELNLANNKEWGSLQNQVNCRPILRQLPTGYTKRRDGLDL